MHDSIRVLVVEHSDSGRFLAQQLVQQFDLDFSWQSVVSEPELRELARQFAPSVVLCVDETSPNTSHASLDMLRLLSTQKPVILISELSACDELGVTRETDLRPAAAIQPRELTMGQAAPGSAVECACGGSPTPKYLPSILATNTDVAVMSDSDGWITYASVRACQLLSTSCGQLLVSLLGASDDEVLRAPNWATQKGSTGVRTHRLGFINDWTLIPAQAHIHDLIGCLTAHAREGNSSLALLGLNLDGLQLLSEAHGRAMGDEVLNHMGAALRSDVTRCGMAARVGRDDFVIVLPDLSCAPDAAMTVQGILDAVSERRRLQETQLGIEAIELIEAPSGMEATSGIDATPGIEATSGNDEPEDLALFAEEPAGRPHTPGTVAAPDKWVSMLLNPETAPRGLPVQSDLEDAIQRHALSLQYQPQFELSSGRGCGVEVLARWIRSNGESTSPAVFIPLAERGGTMRTLGAWVLDCACQTAAAWRGRESQNLTLSVNVSTQQIDDTFQGVLLTTLKHSGFPAHRLELEISESAVIANNLQTIRCLKQWKDLGVRIAVNHFGIDYSSLSYLTRLKVDRLKLDKSLIHNMTLNRKGAGVMDALISLGAELGVDVIAEGVETEPQFRMLTELGCPQVQGYLLARPMHATQAQVALRKTWGNLPKFATHGGDRRGVPPQQMS